MSEKPIISGFNQLASLAIQKYERYLPTAFDESMSILQKMNKIIEHLNDIGMITNDLIEQWNTVMEWVLNDGLNASVNAKLNAMVADGTFNQIINVELMGSLSDLKTTKKDNLVNAINDNHHKILETGGYGVISGLKVKAQATPNMSVFIEAGTIHMQDGKRFTISEINSLPVTTSDPSNNRIDIVYISSLGVVTYLNGDLGGFPPATPTGGFKLAEIRVNAGVVNIVEANITDMRLMKENNNNINSKLIKNIQHLDISPDDFNGNDFEKLQQAIDYSQTNKTAIKLDRQYDITGLGKLLINQPDGVVRKPLVFKGVRGGGITKNDSGFMFGSNTIHNSDIHFNTVFFNSVQGVGTIVYQTPNLIRLKFDDCFFKNVDHLVKGGDEEYIQSLRLTGNTVIGGFGFFLDFSGAYDLQILNELVEQRQSYFNHRDKGVHNRLYGCNIKQSTIEGLSGTAMLIGSCESLTIEDNYFELNDKEIEFLPTANLFGLSIKGNRHGGTTRTSTSLFKLGGQARGVTIKNNTSQNLPIVDTTALTVGEVLFINNDAVFIENDYIDPQNRLKRYRYDDYKTYSVAVDGFNGHVANKGLFKRLYSRVDNVVVPADGYQEVQIQFAEDLNLDSLIGIQMYTNYKKVIVANYYRDFTNKKILRVYLKNLETTEVTVNNIFVTVLQTGTITG